MVQEAPPGREASEEEAVGAGGGGVPRPGRRRPLPPRRRLLPPRRGLDAHQPPPHRLDARAAVDAHDFAAVAIPTAAAAVGLGRGRVGGSGSEGGEGSAGTASMQVPRSMRTTSTAAVGLGRGCSCGWMDGWILSTALC